jgi:hypothetical protein
MMHDSEGVTDCVQQRGSTKVVGAQLSKNGNGGEISLKMTKLCKK